MDFSAQNLTGRYVRLEPLAERHLPELCDAIMDGELWKLFVTLVPHPKNIESFYQKAITDFNAGDGLAFATIDNQTNKLVGSTRFLRAQPAHKRVEIGYTFLAKSAQKTKINTEAKYLMLRHAFEVMAFNRVEFLTDFLNVNSRRAIARLGAREEGILRNHMVMPDGRVRDSVIFSIVNSDWPGVNQLLQQKLNAD